MGLFESKSEYSAGLFSSWFYYLSLVVISYVLFRLSFLHSTVTEEGCLFKTWLAYGSAGTGLVHVFQLVAGLFAGLGCALLISGLAHSRWLEGALVGSIIGFCIIWYLALVSFESLLLGEMGSDSNLSPLIQWHYPNLDLLGNPSCTRSLTKLPIR